MTLIRRLTHANEPRSHHRCRTRHCKSGIGPDTFCNPAPATGTIRLHPAAAGSPNQQGPTCSLDQDTIATCPQLMEHIPDWADCAGFTPNITSVQRIPASLTSPLVTFSQHSLYLPRIPGKASCSRNLVSFPSPWQPLPVPWHSLTTAPSPPFPTRVRWPLVLAVDGTKGPHTPTSLDPASPLNAIADDYLGLGYAVEHVEYPGGILAGVAGWDAGLR